MKLRDYQLKALDDLEAGWIAGHKCQLLRMGTGTGKSATSAAAIRDHNGGALAMAHRGEIVSQLSLALARENIRHRVIGPESLMRLCMAQQIDDLGTHFVDPGARVGVASVQTLALIKGENAFLRQVGYAMADEHHHFIKGGVFAKALEQLPPQCRVLGPSACTLRGDGKGLGRWASGYVDHMVLGPNEAEMMARGFLSPYKIFAPPTSFHRETLHTTASGEFKADEVKQEAQRSTIFGDAVKHYVEFEMGRLALQFCDSIENATIACEKMRAAGVRSEVLSGKTHPDLRRRILHDFKLRKIHHISSCSLVDEGFDLPGIEVVLDTRPTTSLNRYRQGFGRGWRPVPGKVFHYYDFVSNTLALGLPDGHRVWSLNDRERATKGTPSDVIPTKTCTNPNSPGAEGVPCLGVYEATEPCCPYCGFKPQPARRDGPEFVDGVLRELDEATLARLRGAVAAVDGPAVVPWSAAPAIQGNVRKMHAARQVAQHGLRGAMALWGGWQEHLGRSQDESEKRFFYRYGVDTLSALALGSSDAAALEQKVRAELAAHDIIAADSN